MVEIKNTLGKVIYTDNHTDSIKEALEKAVSEKVDLTGADLRKADLTGANLQKLVQLPH